MCFTDPPKTPQVIRTDPVADAAKAAAEAQATANAETATRRTTRRMSALSTGAGVATSAMSAGKTTLGG